MALSRHAEFIAQDAADDVRPRQVMCVVQMQALDGVALQQAADAAAEEGVGQVVLVDRGLLRL